MSKKLLWYSYDFANSFLSIAVIFYIPLILSEKGIADYWIGIPSSIATLILLSVMPYFGFMSDKIGKKIYFLRWTSALMILTAFVLAYITQNNLGTSSGLVLFGLFYVLFWIFFQAGITFYSAMLKNISADANGHYVSGVGIALGQFGNAIGLYVIGMIIATGVGIFGIYDKNLSLVLGAVLFGVLSFAFLRSRENSTGNDSLKKFSYRDYLTKILSNKKIMWALIAYSLLADSIQTFQIYLTVYIKRVFDVSEHTVLNIGILGLLFAVLGGVSIGFFIKKIGMERTIICSIFLYTISFVIFSIIPSVLPVIYFIMAIAGIAYGALFSSYRAYYAHITPANEQAEYFSIYTVFERAASVFGPLVWSLTFFIGSYHSENFAYRFSLMSLVVVIVLGLLAFNKSRKYQI